LRNYFVAHVPDGKESDAATEKPKDQLSRDFGVVRFSTLATISAKSDLPPSALSTHLCHSVINFVALDIAVQALTIMAKTTARKRLLLRDRALVRNCNLLREEPTIRLTRQSIQRRFFD
jgi:hypothetical protein